jgi:hypothetical protein
MDGIARCSIKPSVIYGKNFVANIIIIFYLFQLQMGFYPLAVVLQ